MRGVQLDVGHLTWGMEVFAYPERKKHEPENITAAIDICNCLLLYDVIHYDGSIHSPMGRNLRDLISKASDLLGDTELSQKLHDRIKPFKIEDKSLERPMILDAGSSTLGNLSEIIENKSVFYNKLKIYDKTGSLSPPSVHLYPYLDKTKYTYDDLKSLIGTDVVGHRFYRALISLEDPKKKDELCKLYDLGLLSIELLKVFFTRFRTEFGIKRATYIAEKEGYDVHYLPTQVRRDIAYTLGENIRQKDCSLADDFCLGFSKIWKDDSTCYMETPWIMPLAVNLLLTNNAPDTPTDLLRNTLEYYYNETLKKLKEGLSHYCKLKTEKEREDFLIYFQNVISSSVKYEDPDRNESTEFLKNIVKDNVNLLALSFHIKEYHELKNSEKRTAALALVEPFLLFSNYTPTF